MTLHYSVTGGENGGNITLRGGIDAAHVAGESDYVGFGFQPDQEMIGGNAIIVQTCTTCESGKTRHRSKRFSKLDSLPLPQCGPLILPNQARPLALHSSPPAGEHFGVIKPVRLTVIHLKPISKP